MDHLLPSNATPLERAIALAGALDPQVGDAIEAMRNAKRKRPLPDSYRAPVMQELGLDQLMHYLNEEELALAHGPDLYKIRSAMQAVRDALDLGGYDVHLEEAPIRRLKWHHFQIATHRLRDNETRDLEKIDGLAEIMSPLKSHPSRGFWGYDVRAAEISYAQIGACLIGDDSGVTVNPTAMTWSFGRSHDHQHYITEIELTRSGVFIADSASPLVWTEANFPWAVADFPWDKPASAVRVRLMAYMLASAEMWLQLEDVDSQTIGYRRCRAVHQVRFDTSGCYQVAGSALEPDQSSGMIYVEAMTDFGDGAGKLAVSASLLLDPHIPDADIGRLWRGPGELSPSKPAIAQHAVHVELGQTVREQFRFLLRVT